MKRHARKAYNALKRIGAPVFERSDIEYFGISAEHNNSHKFLDYYGEFRGGYPYISEEVTAILNENGLYCEWESPGSVTVYDA